MASVVIRVDQLRSLAAGSITTTYSPVGSGFAHQVRILHLVNNTDGDMLISFDGYTDNIFIPANSFTLYDVTANKLSNVNTFVFSERSLVLVKYSTAPTTGAYYVICLYAKGE